MRVILASFAFLWVGLVQAQQIYRILSPGDVTIAGSKLSMPFAGGINAAQIQTMDADGDGKEEYIVWDINARMVSVFKEENGNFTHLPELSYGFPRDISGFMVLADYDGDGKKDLFTSSPFGIKAYKNASTPTQLRWEEAQPFLRLDNGSNVTANSLDIPLLLDLDGDGDLDILTFNFATGDYLEYYRNTSMERKGTADIDGFASAQVRWGGFEFCSCGVISFGRTCTGQPIAQAPAGLESARVEHAGGHSMLFHDFTGNGARDLLIGQDECNTLYFLPNKGTDQQPIFDEFQTELPGIGPLPQFPLFHAAYFVKDQLLIGTHSSEPSFPFGIDFSASIYQFSFEENAENPLTERFLQEQMIDFGENARPFFLGNQQMGNLIVTANQVQNGRTTGKAFHLQLINRKWEMVSDDYLSLSRLNLRELAVQHFRSHSGTDWLVVSGDEMVNAIPEKKILWTEADNPENFRTASLPSFVIRGVDQPYFFSHQGNDYLLLARQTGELVLFRAIFGTSLTFELLERNFLGFSDNPVNRALSVTVVQGPAPFLFAVDQRGILTKIENFMTTPIKTEVLVLTGEDQLRESRLGRNTWITALTDPFAKGVDLILGTRAGGLMYLKDITEGLGSPNEALQVRVYPNPATTRVSILVNRDATGEIIDSAGRRVMTGIPLSANRENLQELQQLAPGLYVLWVFAGNEASHFKLMIHH
ncbi:hypothetical protein ADIS_1862 [Lunatimonas lonarensis]|uniref:Uncharacterized protein n=1 Tax=Lunatimonas lonarensis TaxID=1232681 RepID=R7ZUD7_9BACT|nr:T9SS type A sorting domain-containing protein [Lunatimonas lonarensis]EON77643.1 hypothetical protein ADIS_1862 [Lunatimonas lonarensis]